MTQNAFQGKRRVQRGAALLTTFLMMLTLSGLALAVGVCAHNSLLAGKDQVTDKQAYYLAEAGWQRARQQIASSASDKWVAASSPGNTVPAESLGAGTYVVTILDNTSPLVENGTSDYTITSQAYVPNQTSPVAQRRIIEYETDVSVSNTNLSLSATASASSTKGSNTAAKAKDGDTGTKWQANTKGPNEWLQMDYGSVVTADKMVIKDDGNINSAVTIQFSDDGSSWTTVSGSTITQAPNNTFTITFTSTSHRYFRALFPDVASSKRVGVKEMEAYSTVSRSVTFTGAGDVTTQQ
jgi:hypothetical protein